MFNIEALLHFKESSKKWYYLTLYFVVLVLGIVLAITTHTDNVTKLMFILYPQLYLLPVINNIYTRYFSSIQLIVLFPFLFSACKFLNVYTPVWFLIVLYITFEFFINNFKFYVYLLLIIYHFVAMLYVYGNMRCWIEVV